MLYSVTTHIVLPFLSFVVGSVVTGRHREGPLPIPLHLYPSVHIREKRDSSLLLLLLLLCCVSTTHSSHQLVRGGKSGGGIFPVYRLFAFRFGFFVVVGKTREKVENSKKKR